MDLSSYFKKKCLMMSFPKASTVECQLLIKTQKFQCLETPARIYYATSLILKSLMNQKIFSALGHLWPALFLEKARNNIGVICALLVKIRSSQILSI